ncbi:Histidine phosphatase superfamily (branch 1), partial [Bacillus sp. 71mf]
MRDKLAGRLRKENWDFIYSSDLLRAKQTAEIIGG